jgi:hypothetical protein
MRLTFRFFANLHLHGKKALVPAASLFKQSRARNACFLGNIGNPREGVYQEFLANAAAEYDRVFVIAGRCEYLGLSNGCRGIDRYLDDMCNSMGNCYFLQDSAIRIDQRLTVAGGTFREGGQTRLLSSCREHYANDSTMKPGAGQTLLLSHFPCQPTEMGDMGDKGGGYHWVTPGDEEQCIVVDGHPVPTTFTLPF